MINALIFPLRGVNLRLEDDGCSAPSLCCPAITLTGHCCYCCWCCRLPSDCIHGTGSHRHGDGPREEDPGRGGREGGNRELPVHLQRVQWWWGWIGILFDGRKSCWLEPNQFPIKSCFFFFFLSGVSQWVSSGAGSEILTLWLTFYGRQLGCAGEILLVNNLGLQKMFDFLLVKHLCGFRRLDLMKPRCCNLIFSRPYI